MFQQPRPTPRCFGGNTVKALSIRQIVCGSLAIVLGIAIIIPGSHGSELFRSGYPIWTGGTFLATGIIGIFAARRKNKCMIIPLMVLSILSSILAGTVTLVLASVALSSDVWGWCGNLPYSRCPTAAIVTFDVLLILLALLELGLAIATSVMTCYAICPGCSEGGTDGCTCCTCDPCNSSRYQAPSVAYQVGADGRLVQIPSQYVIQGGQPIAMASFPPSQPQHATVLPAGAMAQQQPQAARHTEPCQHGCCPGVQHYGRTGSQTARERCVCPGGSGCRSCATCSASSGTAEQLGMGSNIQYVIAASTTVTGQQAAAQPQSVPQVQFQQPSQAVPYPQPAQLQPQQQPNVPQGQVPAPPTGSSPPPGYQPTESDAHVAANQAMPTEEDDVPLIED